MFHSFQESSSCNEASAVQSYPDDRTGSSSNLLRVTILGEEWDSSKGGHLTMNRELAIQLAKHPNMEITMYLPKCSEMDKSNASDYHVQLIEAEKLPGYDPIDWLAVAPEKHAIDFIIGHGVRLGRQISVIKKHRACGWIQVVHTAPEEVDKYETNANAISKGKKMHQEELELCKRADQVLAVGPKLAEAYRRYLCSSQKDHAVLDITPSIFPQYSQVKQASEDRNTFGILMFGHGHSEDFCLKGCDIAVQAVTRLKESSYHLTFVGAPVGKEDEVTEELKKCGISPSQLTVRCFNESREFLASLFCQMDLVIMPSRTEGFGFTALEAMSGSLPILVSGNSGFGEALRQVPFGSSFVVDSEDPDKWAEKIKAIRMKERSLRLDEARKLKTFYANKFSWKKLRDSLYEAMCTIMSSKIYEFLLELCSCLVAHFLISGCRNLILRLSSSLSNIKILLVQNMFLHNNPHL